MPKKLFAVTNVKIGSGPDEFFPAGTVIDHSKLSKEQLKELHDQGAVEIRTVDDANEPAPEAPATEEATAPAAKAGSAGAVPDTSDKDTVKEDVSPGPGTEPVK